MFAVDITTESLLPDRSKWHVYATTTAINEQIMQQDDYTDVQDQFVAPITLNRYSIDRTRYNDELLQIIHVMRYPLRKLLTTPTMFKITKEWLGYWELYTTYYYPTIKDNIVKRITGRFAKPLYQLRSFHIHDANRHSIHTMEKLVNRLEYELSVKLDWRWLATSIDPTNEHYCSSVDNTCAINTNNMRAWQHKIQTSLTMVDLIVDNSTSNKQKPAAIAFALLNIRPGGTVFIQVPYIGTTAIVSMMYIFSKCFEEVKIIKLVAIDRVYLYGQGFLNNITETFAKRIMKFCDRYRGAENLSIFNSEITSSEAFSNFVEKLIMINQKVDHFRIAYYYDMAGLYDYLADTHDESLIIDYLQNRFKDQSKKWLRKTKFNFFVTKIE